MKAHTYEDILKASIKFRALDCLPIGVLPVDFTCSACAGSDLPTDTVCIEDMLDDYATLEVAE